MWTISPRFLMLQPVGLTPADPSSVHELQARLALNVGWHGRIRSLQATQRRRRLQLLDH
jgi:hypothetical protein